MPAIRRLVLQGQVGAHKGSACTSDAHREDRSGPALCAPTPPPHLKLAAWLWPWRKTRCSSDVHYQASESVTRPRPTRTEPGSAHPMCSLRLGSNLCSTARIGLECGARCAAPRFLRPDLSREAQIGCALPDLGQVGARPPESKSSVEQDVPHPGLGRLDPSRGVHIRCAPPEQRF